MNIQTAEKLAKDLIAKHLTGISTNIQTGYPGMLFWHFQWDNCKRRYGVCRGKGTISLSMPLTKTRSEEEVRDTILHEIAHALAGHSHGHDNQWKSICRKIGARPERCVSTENPLTAPYTANCNCGITHKFFKWTSCQYSCKKCKQPLKFVPCG